MNAKPWGIQKRAVFLALTPAAVIAIALTAYFLVVRYGDVEAALQNRGQALVRQLAPAAEYGAFSGNRIELGRLAQAAAREPDIVYVAFYDAVGQLLANAGEATSLNANPRSGGEAQFSDDVQVFQATVHQPLVSFEDPFQGTDAAPAQADRPALGRVVVGISRSDLNKRKREILWVTLLVTVAVLGTGLLLAVRLGRDIIQPVLALEDAVARIRAGALNTRISPHPSGTLESLEGGFNEMAESLEASYRRSASALADSEAELARQLGIARAKKDEAERASEAKSRFLAAASHDLRQPLHALTLFATELVPVMTSLENRKLATQIVTATGAINELLDALLDMSRLDIAAVQPHRQQLPLDPLLEMIADSYRQTASTKGLQFRRRSTTAWVDTDPHLLRRMVGNLIANAIRYTQQGGVLVAARTRGNRIVIEVWDTGIGIDADHIPYLFDEFYQVGNPERDSSKGLGLGLSIVSRLGQIMDHPVSVASRPGRGSVFSISLPRTAPTPHAAIEEVHDDATLPIIIWLDDKTLAEKLGRLLAGWGYDPVRIQEGATADTVRSLCPAVVIVDATTILRATEQCDNMDQPPRLIVFAGAAALPRIPLKIDAQLPHDFKPARLRALIRQLLAELESAQDKTA